MEPLALLLLVLAAVALAQGVVATDSDDNVDLLRVQPHAQAPLTDSLLFVVARATFGTALPRIGSSQNDGTDGALLQIVRGNVSDDCTRVVTVAEDSNAAAGDDTLSLDAKTAVLVDRGGNCSFVQKALAAQHSGASLVVVRDTVMGAFASASQATSTAYDCSLGKGFVSSNASFPLIDAQTRASERKQVRSCTNAHTCSSHECMLTGKRHKRNQRFEICCFQSRLVRMSVTEDQQELAHAVRIPAIFLSYRDAKTLEQLMKRSSSVSSPSSPVVLQAFNSEESPWNVSMALSWLLGVCVVMGAAYHSCTHERIFSYQKVAHALANSLQRRTSSTTNSIGDGYVSIDDDQDDRDHAALRLDDGNETGEPHRDERLELTGRHALLFLLGASCVLVVVYYVHLLLLISVLFAIGASVAVAQIVFVPLTLTVLPDTWASGNKVFYISGALGLLVGISWFVERSWPSIWPLQDLLCIALCFVFIDTIELPSLRVGAILLSVAFVYDVFFVYFSPFVFGSNVMVDVASGGGNTRRALGLDYCEQHPQDVTCLQHHQSVPMVLSIPLLFSFYGGNALLGLGDLIMPGLLVAFCIRYDYCMGYPLSTKYFCVASVSYAVGLLIANVMAILLRNVVAGQPALMYIVPLMLAAVIGFAKWNGELQVLWDGPLCLQMLDDDVGVVAGYNDSAEERGETQPLVRTFVT